MPMQPVDPWSAGIMGATSVATAALDDKTNQTLNNSFKATNDNSGFVVNIGAGSASASIDKSSSALGLSKSEMMLAGAAALFFVLRHKK